MVEIFTTGGGEYIVNVLNAVASWTGAGGYKSLIQVALVMGFALAVIVVAFNQNWRAWLNRLGRADDPLDRGAFFNTYPLAIQETDQESGFTCSIM